jgi:molybdopterin-guanine dinucleotide biosynthesis protein A
MVVTAPGRPIPDGLLKPGSAGNAVRLVEDRREDAGPLAGIEAALIEARHDLVLVLAGAHPQASPVVLGSLVRTLAAMPSADAVALGTRRGPQPLVAAYRRSAATTVTALLDGGERRATSLPDHLTIMAVAESSWRDDDPEGLTALDVDTPEDLLRWEATR